MKMLIALLALIPLAAFAGKKERDYMTGTVTPAVKKAEKDFNTACGCKLAIKVADSIKSEDDMYQATHVAESLSSEAAGYCTDADSKKAVCQMKSLEIGKVKETKFSFSSGKGVSMTDGQSYAGFSLMTQELDK